MSLIHPTAIVEKGATLGSNVSIGPYSIVGSHVTLEDDVSVEGHVILAGKTTIGARTKISAFAAVGGAPQDLSYKGELTTVSVGADCVIREHVTVHCGTVRGRGATVIGSNCFFMIGSHVAHDCVVGNNVILTNQVSLAGHAEVGDFAILGGLSGVQQRGRVGPHAFIGGLSGVTQDIVPYAIVSGRWARLAGINVVGLKRRGFSKQTIHRIRDAYRLFFLEGTGSRAERLEKLLETCGGVDPAVDLFIDFIRETGDRPLAQPRAPGDMSQRDGNEEDQWQDGEGDGI